MVSSRRQALARVLDRVDRYQREHRWVGLPCAVVVKFTEDHGGYLAALLTYYGFLSLFPLLLIATTVLGFVLAGNPGLHTRLLHTAFAEFPLVGQQLATNIHPLHGSLTALVVGLLVAGYGAVRVARAAQYALNQVWAIPRYFWPDPLRVYIRALLLLAVLAAALLATAGLSWLRTTLPTMSGTGGSILTHLLQTVPTLCAAAVNAGVILLAFRVLTARHIPLRNLRAGAVGAGIVWQLLLELGTYIVAHKLGGINAAYGLFSIVLALIAWIYLGALITVLAAEFNAVRAGQLTPRSLRAALVATSDLTPADRRAYSSYAAVQRHTSAQHVDMHFGRANPDPDTERTNPHIPPPDPESPT